MNKTLLIAKHELLITLRRKSFAILTLAFPVVALLGILAGNVIPGLISPPSKVEKIGYIDEVGIFNTVTPQGTLELVPFNTTDSARDALLSKDIKEYYVIPPDYLAKGIVQRYTLTNEVEPGASTRAVVSSFLIDNLLQGDSTEIIARVKAPLNIASTTLTSTGEVSTNQGGFAALILPYIFSILLMMAIFSSSGYLLQGLLEEKENRVMEIILSSVSPAHLLSGKIFGLGAAGLAQIIVWLISATFLFRLASANFSNILGSLNVTSEFLILGLVYFVLGYLLEAVLMATVGSLSSTAREGQQMSALFIIPVIIPIYFMPLIQAHPENVVVKILTFLPFTAPITVMSRLGLSDIPFWELAVSIVLIAATILGCFVLASKIFRTYLLMYGKRPGLGEVWRGLKQA